MKSTMWVVLLLLLTCTYTQLQIAKANIVTNEGTIASYQPYIAYPSNTSYSPTVSVLNVSFRAEVWGNVKYSMVYSLDGKENESLPLVDHYFSWVQGQHDKSYVDGSAVLPELANGSHRIKVFLECNWQIGYSTGWKDNYYYDSEEVYFTVENSISTSNVPAQIEKGPVFIKADGSVSSPGIFKREGNIYSLTGDLDIVPIVVECNSIVLDGKGFASKSMSGWSEQIAINLTASNVTVRNFNFANYGIGILGAWNNNTILNNTFRNVIKAISIYGNGYNVTGNSIQNSAFFAIRLLNTYGNTFFENNLSGNSIGFDVTNSTENLAVANTLANNHEAFRISNGGFQVYHNNFVNQFQQVSPGAYSALILSAYSGSIMWDNGYPSGGNYYSDYLDRYPNATEVDDSGIGNTPCQVSINSNLTDRYPLLEPVNVSVPLSELPSPVLDVTPLGSPTPSSSPTLSPTPTVPEFPSWIILPAFLIFMGLVTAAIKRKSVLKCRF